MNDQQILVQLAKHMKEAESIHPHWPSDPLRAASNVMEEVGEMFKEANNIAEMEQVNLLSECPSGYNFGSSFLYRADECKNCTLHYSCSRAKVYYNRIENLKTEAFHSLVTIIRFLRNFERY